ncbi:hypothetical protein [Streptomyces sp. N2A]|uniref:hypothetical protein n=1 Tax=Streptomyces sp. N2A TaxID=3073936 RepID=UPI00286FBB7D|nr:hypothetical protein [Streptomyces sp. N2A]
MPPSGGTPWGDCLYEHPQPSSDVYVNSFGNTHLNVGVTLRCGSHDRPGKTGFGVRHIKDGPGFNEYTECCVELVVMTARSLPPGSGQNNQVLKYSKDGVTGVVVFDVNRKNVVTAYTQGSGGDGNWHGCTSKLA